MIKLLPIKNIARQFWFAVAGVLLLCAVAGFFVEASVASQLQYWSKSHGQALVNQAALRARDAAINRDLVSLQVVVGEIVQNSSVLNATVHDLENKLLVQAGPRATTTTQTSFTAPITARDNVAGYLTLTLDTSSLHKTSLRVMLFFALLGFSLIALVLACALFVPTVATSAATTSTTSATTTSTTSATASTRAAALRGAKTTSIPIVTTPPAKEFYEHSAAPRKNDQGVELTIYFKNLNSLFHQLNQSAFRSLCQRLEMQLRGILALYSGQLLQVNLQSARIAFNEADTPQAVLNALCSAQLFSNLCLEARLVQLQCACLLAPRAADNIRLKQLDTQLFSDEENAQLMAQAENSAILIDNSLLANNPALLEKIHLSDATQSNDYRRLIGIAEPYAALLKRQQTQLTVN